VPHQAEDPRRSFSPTPGLIEEFVPKFRAAEHATTLVDELLAPGA